MANEIRRVAWTETVEYHAYVVVPENFDGEKYDVENALGQINSDIHHDGTTRTIDAITVVPWLTVPPNEEVEEIDWEMFDDA